MATDGRKRHVVRYENMSDEVAEAFAEKYPRGFNDYLDDLVKYPNPDGIYLVKIEVDVDDADDIERWLEGEEEAGTEQMTGAGAPTGEGEALPDDNVSQYGGDDDPADA